MQAMEMYGCDVQIKFRESEAGERKAYVMVLSEEKNSISEDKVMAMAKYLWDEGFIEDEEVDVNVVYIGDRESYDGGDEYGEI